MQGKFGIKLLTNVLLVTTVSFMACNSDQVKMKKMEGRWELKDATTNGISSIGMMKGVFIQFAPNNLVSSSFNVMKV
jgi:hypothetical protein